MCILCLRKHAQPSWSSEELSRMAAISKQKTCQYFKKMRDELIPEERILAVQEALCGFINDEVLDVNGEFYYDGESYINNKNKYDNIV